MNKKRKILYLMLPIIILVWGYVLFQFFSFFSSSPNYATAKENTEINIEAIENDTFTLVANYRDPFLDKPNRIKRANRVTNSKKKSVKNTSTSQPEKSWPSIQYKGMIKNNNSKVRVGIVIVNGTEQLIKEGEEVKGIMVLKISKDQIEVRFQHVKKTILK